MESFAGTRDQSKDVVSVRDIYDTLLEEHPTKL